MSKIDPTDARQGRKGNRVLIILIAGLALALIAFLGMGFFGASQPDENIGGVENSGVSTSTGATGTAPATGGATTVSPAESPAAPAPSN